MISAFVVIYTIFSELMNYFYDGYRQYPQSRHSRRRHSRRRGSRRGSRQKSAGAN